MIVIHPKDASTDFLKVLYKDCENVTHINEQHDYDEVFDLLEASPKNELIMMLGHGLTSGLYAQPLEDPLGRFIIDRDHVDILREHTCIGIWCFANRFAEKHNLKGLFSGMVISEVKEAGLYCIQVEQEQISLENDLYAKRLKDVLAHHSFDQVREEMSKLITPDNEIQEFNYKSFYYYP